MASQKNERLTSIVKKCPKPKYENQMMLYTLPLEKSSTVVNGYSFGEPNLCEYIPSKTILVMGATGSGKTTWINAMINYVLGVEWDDPFRFKLIDEQVKGGSQAHSQTQEVTVYDIYHQNGFRIPFSLTIIDTPGYGDPQGIERDKKITSDITELFTDKKGIEALDAVGFVVQSALARLTHPQKYIFNSVLSIFGKDVKENVRFLVTFAEGKRPPVLEAILAADLPCRLDSKGSPCHQKFNNGAIYVTNQDEEDEMSPIEWKNGMKNFKLFFEELSEMPTKSLQMTKEVLGNRKQMELKLESMQGAIKTHLIRMEELRQKEALIKLNQAEIDANKNFEIKVQVSKNVKEPTDRTALNCTFCEMTCQASCNPNVSIAHSNAFCEVPTAMAFLPIVGWAAMAGEHLVNAIIDRKCKICKCVSTKHEKGKSRWICKTMEETQTLQEMKANYEAAKGKKMNAKQLVEELKKDVDDQKKKIVKEIGEITDLHNSVKKNALHGNPLSTPKYIRMMIEKEKNERQEGYEERIRNLGELLPLAKITDDIVDDADGFLKQQLRV